MIDLCILGTHPWRKRSKKPLTLPNLTAMATSSFFPAGLRVPTNFQASHTAEKRFKVDEYYWCVTLAFVVFRMY